MMRLWGLLLLSLLAALYLTGWRLAVVSRELHGAQNRVGMLSAALANRDEVIARLQQAARQNERLRLAWQRQQARASALALNREIETERETDANNTLRAWSAAALPDDAIRLHSRPAFTNPGDYLEWLSARQQLSDTRRSP